MKKIFFAIVFFCPLLSWAQEISYTDQKPNPLYVLDGKILSLPSATRDSVYAIFSIGSVSPKNIQSIHILKGDSAIAKYGEDGKNGVVIINTIAYSKQSMTATQRGIVCQTPRQSKLPVIILDGQFTQEQLVRDSSQAVISIGKIKPKNIKSIEVLKGAAATAIYGSRASQGVVIITTEAYSKRMEKNKTQH